MSTTLTEVCLAIVDCEHKTALAGDGFALSVGTKAMKAGRLALGACKPVSEDTYDLWTRRLVPEEGDLILAREAPVGDVIRVPKDPRVCLGQRTVLIRPDPECVDPRFLHYWLLGPTAQAVMHARAAGATVPHLNVEDIRALDVSVLPVDLDFQRNAGSILGAIDDLIENNRRRIALLERLAQAIYREWFVHFRYPGHEDDELVHSPLGRIPAGWEVMKLGTVVETQYGFTDSATQSPEGPRFLRVTDINKRSYISWPDVPYCSQGVPDKFLLHEGDVVIARMADPGKIGIVERDVSAVFASYLVRLRPTASWLRAYYLYFAVAGAAYQEFVLGASTGTTRESISAKVMEDGLIVKPTVDILDAFVEAVVPMRRALTALAQEAERLAGIRDLLLPKLVTGAIDVSHLDLDALLDGKASADYLSEGDN